MWDLFLRQVGGYLYYGLCIYVFLNNIGLSMIFFFVRSVFI